MQKQETAVLIATMILSFLFIEFIVMGGLGISICIYVIIYYSIAITYAKKIGLKCSKDKMLLLIPIGLLAICFGLYSNIVLKFLNSILLYTLIMLQTSYMFEASIYKAFGNLFFADAIHTGIVVPLCNITSVTKVIKDQFSGEAQGKINLILKIVLGCVIAVPFLLIVTVLLISSDAAFEALVNITVNNLFQNIGELVAKGVLTLMAFFPIYGLFYGLKHKKKYFEYKEPSSAPGIIDPIIAFTFVTLLSLVYITYCVSQLAYFISAFQMFLPEGFTFSEYARRGFFEFVPLSLINLGVVLGLNTLTKEMGTTLKQRFKKGYITFICIFTIFLIISALSKMFMYISQYGLTLLRIYTSWFLVLMFVVYGIILLKIVIVKINVIRTLFVSFIIMFLGLNFANVDLLIARHNVNLYKVQKENNIDINALYQLSPSAASEVIQLAEYGNEELALQVRELLDSYYTAHSKWQQLTLASYKANQLIDAYK